MIYTVQPGESLQHICQRFHVSLNELMIANQMIVPTVTLGQTLFIPFHSENKIINTGIGNATPQGDYSWRQETPEVTPQIPGFWPQDTRTGNKIAVFQEKDTRKDIPIYNARAAIFFMSKMAIEEPQCFALCGNQCRECFKSESTPFYVMPHNTSWVSLGDYGVVINTRTKKSAFAICGDWGPKHQPLAEGSKFVGRIGEGSIYLGKQLDIKYIAPNPLAGYESSGVLYIVFPGSASSENLATIKSVENINKEAHYAFRKWGGWKQAKFVLKEHYNINFQ